MELDSLLAEITARKASDLHLAPSVPPIFRVNGALVPGKPPNLTTEAIENLLKTALPEDKVTLARHGGDFSATLRHAGETFRCQVVCASGQLAASIRLLPSHIPTLDELELPPIVEKLAHLKRGLLLCVGPTGSGKTTTLVSLLEHINRTRSERIVTVEDPMHYVLHSKLSLITQRVVGEDVESYEQGADGSPQRGPGCHTGRRTADAGDGAVGAGTCGCGASGSVADDGGERVGCAGTSLGDAAGFRRPGTASSCS